MDGHSPRPGRRPCLKCGRDFPSRDLTTNRICPKCNRANDQARDAGPPASAVIYVNGRRVPLAED